MLYCSYNYIHAFSNTVDGNNSIISTCSYIHCLCYVLLIQDQSSDAAVRSSVHFPDLIDHEVQLHFHLHHPAVTVRRLHHVGARPL